MAEAFGCGLGGIQSLLTLPREQWEAIEADAIRYGRRLSDLSWREVMLLVKHASPESAVFAVNVPADAPWPRSDQLMALFIDAVNDFMWLYQCAHTGKGQPTPKRPQPFPQPGGKARAEAGVEHIGSDPIPAADFDAWWANPVSMN